MIEPSEDDVLAYRLVEAAQSRAGEMGRDVRVLLAAVIVRLDRGMVEEWLETRVSHVDD